MSPTVLALNEQIIRWSSVTSGVSNYYGFELTISQADVPYVPVAGSRPASQFDFVVCADTVTINGPLVNPGRDIRVSARQIVFAGGTVIDTGGPDPITTFVADDLPEQTDQSSAAPGAPGASASNGAPAGNVILTAESIVVSGVVSPGAISVSALLPSPLAISDFQTTFTDPANNSYQLALTDLQVAGLSGSSLSPFDSVVSVSSGVSQITFSILVGVTASAELTGAIGEIPIDLQGTMTVEVAASVTAVLSSSAATPPVVTLSSIAPAFTWQAGVPIPLPGTAVADIQQQLQSQLPTAIATDLANIAANLLILSGGGVGGRGQDGHPGIQGAVGAPGKQTGDVVIAPNPPPLASAGGTGSPGGQGGNAGASGSGGAGGQLQITVVNSGAVTICAGMQGGSGGPAAIAGAGGPGGLGGPPGSYYEVNQSIHAIEVTGAPGHQGPQGPAATVQGAAGAAGAIGTAAVSAPATYAQLAPFFPPEQLLITQRVATFAFLAAQTQDDYQEVLQLLLWLNNITAPSLDLGFAPPGWQASDIAIAQQINAFAVSQITNFQAGLDFYGHSHEWVPVLTLSDYQSNLQSLLTIGGDIEQQFQVYTQEGQTETNQLTALQSTNTQLQSTISGLQQQITSLGSQISAADAAIAAMITQMEQQQNTIAVDTTVFTTAFQNYVQEQTDHACSFLSILGYVSDVLQIGSGLVDGVGVVTGAFAAEGAMDTAIKQFKYAITIIEKVASSINAIQTGVTKIVAAIPTSNPDSLTGLLATDQQDFDNFIGKFLNDFAAAGVLKQAVDDYFAMANSLNQAIVSYNGLYLTQANLQAQLSQFMQQQEQLAGVLAQEQPDPTLPVCASAMQSAYTSIKAILVRQLYEENRAYYFWSLQDVPFATDDLTIASLAATNAWLVDAIEKTQEQSQAPYQPFTQTITISSTDIPLAFRQLPTSKTVSFSISPDVTAFENMYQVIASQFTLRFPDIPPQNNVLFVELLHPGTCVQIGTDGTAVQFTHAQRTVPYKIDFGDSSNSAGGLLGAADQGFIGLSPLTLWTMTFSDPGNGWLDLSTIQSVEITFTGTFVGPDSALASRPH